MADIVHVACKLPLGLRIGREIVLRGTSHDIGSEQAPELFGGYAVTHNVPKDTWDEWYSTHSDPKNPSDYVVKRLVFANRSLAALKKMMYARVGTKSGMERVVPKD